MTELIPIPNGSITTVNGFRAAGVAAGLKKNDALDMALVYSETPCAAAAVFTTNAFKAAPVLYDQSVLAHHADTLQAVLINSGCANACTGDQGLLDAIASAEDVGKALEIEPCKVMVMSTGVIGQPLPMDNIRSGIDDAAQALSGELEAGHIAARAIMTTDTRPKEAAVQVRFAGGAFTVAGMVKGSGMIHPNMATMLSTIVSDAPISAAMAQRALDEAVDRSFHMLTVDGDTSTNDTVLVMANGQAEMAPIDTPDSPGYVAFCEGLTYIATQLSKAVVRDGEGATRFIEITVQGARTRDEARQVGMSVAGSSLVKTAIYGQDANWGRIICAVGYAGVEIDPNAVSVWMADLELFRKGAPYDVDEARATAILAQDEVPITIDLAQGQASATVWTCDLSHDYVSINADYRT